MRLRVNYCEPGTSVFRLLNTAIYYMYREVGCCVLSALSGNRVWIVVLCYVLFSTDLSF